MGPFAFFAGLLLGVMGMGKWQETGSPFWLWGSVAFLLIVLISGISAVLGGKRADGGGLSAGRPVIRENGAHECPFLLVPLRLRVLRR